MKRFFFLLSILMVLIFGLTMTAFAQIEFIDPAESEAAEESTADPVAEPASSSSSEAYADREVSPEFRAIVDQLADEGKISTTDGTYYYLYDFSNEWAQLYWYQWTQRSTVPVNNFVVRAKIRYESASQTPNWAESGCGWWFRGEGPETHLVAYYTLEGNGQITGARNNYYLSYGSKRVGSPAVSGEVEMVVYADGPKIGLLIDGITAIDRSDLVIDNLPVELHSVTLSGTNKDFGIRCEYSDIEFMVF